MKWKAHDENDDSLIYSIYYRGDGETRWKLLRDGVDERFVNLDSDLFPDGGYNNSRGRLGCAVALARRHLDRREPPVRALRWTTHLRALNR